MDWREYIQQREHFATPQRGHLAALLAAIHDRPGATSPGCDAAKQDEEAVKTTIEGIPERRTTKPVKVAQMSFPEYLAFRNHNSDEAAHPL